MKRQYVKSLNESISRVKLFEEWAEDFNDETNTDTEVEDDETEMLDTMDDDDWNKPDEDDDDIDSEPSIGARETKKSSGNVERLMNVNSQIQSLLKQYTSGQMSKEDYIREAKPFLEERKSLEAKVNKSLGIEDEDDENDEY